MRRQPDRRYNADAHARPVGDTDVDCESKPDAKPDPNA